MPVVNGRLTCWTCGADLGDADDPYRDPDCIDCINRQEDECDADSDEPDWDEIAALDPERDQQDF